MNVKRHVLISLLALWLPVQSLAGALLHCELIGHASVPHNEMAGHEASAHELHIAAETSDDNPLIHANHAEHAVAVSVDADSALQPADCHVQAAPSNRIELIDSSASGDDEVQCNHCNGSCHGIQQLSLHTLSTGFVSTLNTFSPSSTAAEISSIPENPQRPPKLF